jgi:two-component system chemotaxis response regulator CheY
MVNGVRVWQRVAWFYGLADQGLEEAPSRGETMTGFESLRVLLVDDNQHMRAIVTTVLAGVGVKQVRETRDGSEALEALRDWPADLAIVDFQMFPMDGVEFTRIVRNAPDSRNPYLPVIMMTGHSEKSRVFDARDAGVTEFVAKPLTAKAVLDRIQAVIYRPRPFVRTASYFGPDRRRRDDPAFTGPWLRSTDQDREAKAKAAADKAGELEWDEA